MNNHLRTCVINTLARLLLEISEKAVYLRSVDADEDPLKAMLAIWTPQLVAAALRNEQGCTVVTDFPITEEGVKERIKAFFAEGRMKVIEFGVQAEPGKESFVTFYISWQ